MAWLKVSKPPMRTAGADGRIGQGTNPAPSEDGRFIPDWEHQFRHPFFYFQTLLHVWTGTAAVTKQKAPPGGVTDNILTKQTQNNAT